MCSAWCTALAYDEEAKYAFIGDYSGQITVCQLSETGVKLINILKGHSGSVQTLTWDGSDGLLYSGSYDCSVFVWDIGGRRGTVYELHGHKNKVNSVRHIPNSKKVFSTGEDSNLVLWDMAARRDEVSVKRSELSSEVSEAEFSFARLTKLFRLKIKLFKALGYGCLQR